MWLGPVLDVEIFEAREIPGVDRDQDKSVGMSDRRDLSIGVWRGSAKSLETSSLFAMPHGGNLVIRKDWKCRVYDVVKIRLESGSALALGQPTAAVRELVPHRCRDGALMTVLVEPFDNLRVGNLGDGRGHDARVQKISKRQRETLRPRLLSRVDGTKSSSSPISSSECIVRKFL